ncbi:tripartite tricarboxylate transporter TctB family protein [Oleidesulfovibrio sp.]|uniref:tripartite tricarboxylate transporter TctB family protein n=1 Tax=Oleidesulfovibrio sp. TaxID=2909707 RepID=UPI003A86DC13
MPKKYAELILLGGFLVLAVLLFSSTASYPKSVQGSTAEYVRFLGLSTGILCVLQIILSMRAKGKAKEKQQEKLKIAAAPRPFWLLVVLLLLYAAGFEFLGFYLASAIFLPVTMVMLGARKPLSIILTSGGVLGFVYFVFEKLLGVYMPVSSLFG